MRAVIFDRPGDEEVLRIADVPSPARRDREIRIAVAGAGVNRADLLQRRGLYPRSEPKWRHCRPAIV
jgi:NADPH:quinone reductase-like Zn-dependent oxidoreductase